MKIFRIISVLAVFVYFIPSAFAADCSNAGDVVSIAKCQEQRYIKADRKLNAVYKEAMKSLPENKEQKLQINPK